MSNILCVCSHKITACVRSMYKSHISETISLFFAKQTSLKTVWYSPCTYLLTDFVSYITKFTYEKTRLFWVIILIKWGKPYVGGTYGVHQQTMYFRFMRNRKMVQRERLRLLSSFPIYVIYSNTLVHSSPHLPVYCMGRWVRLHCFFFFKWEY